MTSNPDGGSGKRRGKPTGAAHEDLSLWQRIASTVSPVKRGKPRVPDVETPRLSGLGGAGPGTATGDPKSSPAGRPRVADAEGKGRSAVSRPAPGPPPPARPHLPALDRRKARRIATGATEIEGRLDLHGMTQSAAHDRLVAFILHSVGLGRRTVLVITGKGGSRSAANGGGEDFHVDGLGILRRNLPRWLAERPLRDVVLGCQQAARRHGGDGAYYVTLRSKRKLRAGS